ncbi:MAG: tRNA lysidine(34) synthetase TilS [Candidatus Saccharibacteria bacterium]
MDRKALQLSQLPPAGRYVIAVSGGVDSVVLLDMFARLAAASPVGDYEIIVAHFDHGIRSDSARDAQLVAKLSRHYGFSFENQREELGSRASEELARTRRYVFLRAVSHQYSAALVTAHHADDSVETIAINISRGTGWRGLAVLDSDIIRPLLDMSKSEIITYATMHQLKWHEDSTNASDDYLRNRIRHRLNTFDDDAKRQLLGLRAQQISLKRQIDDEVQGLVGASQQQSRYFFTHLDPATASECLRRVTRARLTRPQQHRALLAIKTARPGAVYQAGGGLYFRFTSRNFEVELIK